MLNSACAHSQHDVNIQVTWPLCLKCVHCGRNVRFVKLLIINTSGKVWQPFNVLYLAVPLEKINSGALISSRRWLDRTYFLQVVERMLLKII